MSMNPPHGTRFGFGQNDGSEAQKLSGQRSGSERSTNNVKSFVKTAICLTGAETYQGRSFVGAFSGRRLLLGSHYSLMTAPREPRNTNLS